MIRIDAAGALTLVQDLGRPGLAHFGVPPSGAADRAAHLRANALVGNAPGAATLEIVAPGFACHATGDHLCALTGAPAAAELDGRPIAHDTVFAVRAGQRLLLGAPAWGLRTYLSVRGGVAAAPVLGSRATDTLSGIGPAPVRPGDAFEVGGDTDEQDWRAPAPATAPATPLAIPFVPAPGAAWVETGALATGTFVVTPSSGRTALRLDGPPLARRRSEEFPTQGLVRGAIQVPTDGRPIVFLADHPVTGGYPVIGVVPEPHADRLAQLRPGHAVAFSAV